MPTLFILQTFLPPRRRDCLPLHRMLLLPQPSQKHYRLLPTSTLPKPHYPSPRTKLASLVKGRWIDGKTQTVALLLCACDMPTIFILQTFLPSRRRDCISCTEYCHSHNLLKSSTAFRPHQPFQNRTSPHFALNLPPLSKVRFCRPPKIRATTGGIAPPSLVSYIIALRI